MGTLGPTTTYQEQYGSQPATGRQRGIFPSSFQLSHLTLHIVLLVSVSLARISCYTLTVTATFFFSAGPNVRNEYLKKKNLKKKIGTD